MTRKLISSGSTLEEQIGYSRAVVSGDWVVERYMTLDVDKDGKLTRDEVSERMSSLLPIENRDGLLPRIQSFGGTPVLSFETTWARSYLRHGMR